MYTASTSARYWDRIGIISAFHAVRDPVLLYEPQVSSSPSTYAFPF
jgi:hypothetical protein